LLLLAAVTAKASAAGTESREAESRNPSSFLLVPNQETLNKGEKRRRVGWVWLTGEKTTAGWDGRAGGAAADQLYATVATEETPSGRPTLGGVAVRSRPSVLHLLTRFAATAARASPPPLARLSRPGFFPRVPARCFDPGRPQVKMWGRGGIGPVLGFSGGGGVNRTTEIFLSGIFLGPGVPLSWAAFPAGKGLTEQGPRWLRAEPLETEPSALSQ
jgi:hypothetical protein